MDEGIETRQDIPAFIRNAIKQLIRLKSNITSIDDFHNDMKQINVGVNTEIADFANKVKEFLDTFQIKISDINNSFNKSYETFTKDEGSKNSKICKRKSDGANTNSDSGSATQKHFDDDIIENTDSDTPLLNVVSKKTGKSKNENSDSNTNLKKQKTRKKRRKRGPSRTISECDNSDSEHSKNSDKNITKTSSVHNKIMEETLESDEQIKLKSTTEPELNNKEIDTCKTSNDSDKENTKNTNKTSKETEINAKPESTVESINSDFESEKEPTAKTSTEKSKKVVDSNSETDSSIKKSKKNNKKKKLAKKVTDSDIDSDLSITKSKVEHIKNKKTKKSKQYLKDSESDTDKIKKDVGSDSDKNKSKSNNFKNKKTSRIINDSDSDNTIITNADKTKKDTVSDNDSDSAINKSKEKKKDKKADSYSEKNKFVSDDLKKYTNTADTVSNNDSDSEKNQSKTSESNSKEPSGNLEKDNTKNKPSIDSDSDSYLEDPRSIIEKYKKSRRENEETGAKSKQKHLFDSLREADNQKKCNDPVSTAVLEKDVTDSEKTDNKKISDASEKDNTKDKVNNIATSSDSDSDSSLEGRKSIIEKSRISLADKKEKSGSSKNSDNLEINDNPVADVILEKDIVTDSLEESKKLETDKISKIKNTSLLINPCSSNINSTKEKDDIEDTESAINIQYEKPEQVKEEYSVSSDDNKSDNKKEDTPKIGLIKCIDISKLLDPKVKKIQKTSAKLESPVIILSSSESEAELKPIKAKYKKSTNDKSNKKSLENKTGSSKTKVKHNETSAGKSKEKSDIESVDSDSSTNDKRRRLRFNKKKESISNKSFETLRLLRERRFAKKPIVEKDSSSDSNSDSSSDSSVALKDIPNKSNNKRPKLEKISEIDPNYDYKKDIKFKSECHVSLPRIPLEKLKVHYLQERQDAEINRLTNMKSLKRTRQQKGTSSSSDNDAKTVKKRGKLQPRKKTSEDDENSEHSEHSNNSMSDVPILPDKKKEAKLPIPDDLLDSDGDSNKHSDTSDDEDKDKKKSKNGEKKKSGQKTDKETEKEKEDTEENGKDSEKQENKDKNKLRNDPLLKGKLSLSDSEDELIRFRNKKNKITDDIRSKTKKQLKRIARRLGSDVSSSEEEKDGYKKSESENENSDNSEKSSDSEDDNNKKTPVRRRIKRLKDSDDSSDGGDAAEKDKKKKTEEETRKKIRHVWSKDSLADSTKEAAKEEQERKKRIADRQKMYNEIYDNKLNSNSEVDKVVLDFNEETKEELLSVHPDLVKKLKPHQAQGVQFMWTACFESIERAQNTEGSGCILAHCMGLGKTLQVITLIHTLLSNTENTKVKTVLVVCPLSTVLNWVSEFKKWLDDLDGEQVNVFDLVQYKQNYERLYQMQDWVKFGGVMIMGYDMFRNLSNPKGKRMSKKLVNGFNKVLLEPGPDLVVCDEGHLLKNEKTGISIAMNRLKTLRRIVLTGTPLQNNLKEYWCMVQFVKPNLLGTYKEYLNRFVNPITNGQYTDSTLHDIQIMRKRAHVLHKMLDAVVERRDYNVLAPFLPPKHEYVLFVSLSPVQIELYREYLAKFSRNTNVKGTSYLFQDFQELQRVCIHPRVLLDKSNQDKLRREMDDDDSEGSLKDFIDDDESDKSASSTNESSSGSGSESDKKPSIPVRRTRANPGNIDEEPLQQELTSRDEWWSKFCQGDELDNITHSPKIKLLFDILHQCELIGDKVLVFSQSLFSLNLIEYFLAKVDEATQSGDTESLERVGGHNASWSIGLDYFRMDGSTSCENRATWCKTFNNEANTRARLFLISTRAGGLGINLVAANRVIIFDVSWNPSFDIQSIYRVYRFGQTKPCYIYRFVTMGTMENKIYERQVTKQAISKRVIDEQQIDRHYNQTDLAELYAFVPIPDEERPTPLVPKDRLFADLLQTHDKQIFKYHEHNSLLEDKADEGLNEEERQAAWEEFENEKKAPKFNLMQTMVRNGMFETLRILVQEDNNGWTPAQINNILPAVVQRISEQVARGDYSMYRRVEERHELRVLEQRRMQMIYQQYMQQLKSASGGAPMTPADMNKLAQMFSVYNQTLAVQQQMQPRPQVAGSSAAVSFTQGDPPPVIPPAPHPIFNEVVELND